MSVEFVAYIDELGDTGLESVRAIDAVGATEWLILSCFLVRVQNDTETAGWVKETQSHFRNVQSSYLHFADLIPAKKKIACEVLAQKPCALFAYVMVRAHDAAF